MYVCNRGYLTLSKESVYKTDHKHKDTSLAKQPINKACLVH